MLYLMLLRRSVRRAALAARRARALAEVQRVTKARPMMAHPAPHVSVRVDFVTESASRPAPAMAPQQPATGLAPAGADTWEPVPVPLPTYVTAPKARRSIRTIDLDTPGAWTSGRLAEPAPVEPKAPVAPGAETLPQQRAVGD